MRRLAVAFSSSLVLAGAALASGEERAPPPDLFVDSGLVPSPDPPPLPDGNLAPEDSAIIPEPGGFDAAFLDATMTP